MKKILILQGHPRKDSLVNALTQAYYQGAKENGFDVELIHLIDLNFDLILRTNDQALEPDLIEIQQKIKETDHLVLAFPTWWSTMPALVKGFIDRVFLTGFAFYYKGNIPQGLLKGKSARFVMTMDTPAFLYRLLGGPGFTIMNRGILKFSGFKPVKRSAFYTVRASSLEKRTKWIEQMKALGRKGI